MIRRNLATNQTEDEVTNDQVYPGNQSDLEPEDEVTNDQV